jgi:hypothetical protein
MNDLEVHEFTRITDESFASQHPLYGKPEAGYFLETLLARMRCDLSLVWTAASGKVPL